MTFDVAAVGRLRRRGEVPPASTDDRRRWLLGLTTDELIALTRPHGADQDVFSDCLGWGAYRAGHDTDGGPVTCSRCHQAATFPLWFLTDGGDQVPRCWRCAAVDHLTECDRWDLP